MNRGWDLPMVNEAEKFRNGWVKNLLEKVDGKYVGEDASTRN